MIDINLYIIFRIYKNGQNIINAKFKIKCILNFCKSFYVCLVKTLNYWQTTRWNTELVAPFEKHKFASLQIIHTHTHKTHDSWYRYMIRKYKGMCTL